MLELHHLDLAHWVENFGYIGVLAVIFMETGLFFAFFLPGDSLLFVAGLLASQGIFKVEILVPGVFTVAILGYFLGYWFGEKLGNWLMKREDSFWFKKQYLINAHQFYEKHGGKALILGRLIPVVRTFVPVAAGMAKMNYGHYIIYNIVGAFIWSVCITLLGYFLGDYIPNAEHYIFPISLLIIVLSVLPGVIAYLKKRK